jgi:hypothetical protein
MEEIIEYKIASIIFRVFTVLFLIVGSITNLLSAIVYSRKKMQKTSYSFYLFALAIVDLCVTVNGNTRLVLMSYNFDLVPSNHSNKQQQTPRDIIFKGFDIRETSIVMCRVHRFLTYYLLQLSSILLCMLSIDRFFGVVLALKAFTFNKISIARKVILIAIVLLFLFNIHFLIAMGYEQIIHDGNESNVTTNHTETKRYKIKCAPNRSNKMYYSFWQIYFYFDSIIYCIIPFIIMITCNVFTIFKMVKSRVKSKQVIYSKKFTKNKTDSNTIMKNSNKMLANEKRISAILIGISVSFLVLTIPVFIMENLDDEHFKNPILEVALALSYMLMYLNHVINFFFYCAFGPNFRKEVKKLFPCIFPTANKIDPLQASKYNSVFVASSMAATNKRSSVQKCKQTTSHNIILPKTQLEAIQETTINRKNLTVFYDKSSNVQVSVKILNSSINISSKKTLSISPTTTNHL